MGKAPDLSDYTTVDERILEFVAKHPEGSLRPLDPAKPYELITTPDGKTYVVCAVAAYRDREDPAPAVGIAWEPFPGRTPYTRESELMNAETSARGRALAALGIGIGGGKGASYEEVRNRSAEREGDIGRTSQQIADWLVEKDDNGELSDTDLRAAWREAGPTKLAQTIWFGPPDDRAEMALADLIKSLKGAK
jgi:hypothetical protein